MQKKCPKCGKDLKCKEKIITIILALMVIPLFILVNIDDIAKIGSSKEGSNISDTSKIYYMGDTVNLGDFSVTLENYQTKEKGDKIDSYNVVDDQQWIAIFLKYTNISEKEKYISRNVRVINGNGEVLQQPTFYYNVWDGEHLDSTKLMSGGSKTDFLVFTNTIIDDPRDIKIEISNNSRFDKKSTFSFKLYE